MKKWIIDKTDSAAAQKLAAKCGISPLSAEILTSRGICGIEDAAIFFGGGEGTDEMQLYSPFDLPDMQKAADAVNEAVDSGERIMIYGDYDCDGILSTAALYNYLDSIGADVGYFINDRADGYGMNIKNVKKLADEGAEMIITVDNGISAVEEARFCAENGIKLVITDHHTPPPELPEAIALVDPHISSPDNTTRFRDMCGCGVVLKLIAAMEGGETAVAVEMMSDFAALATIADVMPLTGENRTIVRHGLHFMQNTENEGLKALIEAVSVGRDGKRYNFEYASRTLAFTVVPRINASGRMGSAMDAAELFTTDDPQRAAELAARLCEWNDERKSIENEVLSQI
ncbi:MAG: DHH family phosphoesterase [Oscillospiraceae bacterium]|nr:DHH family phosphoesterase [Oscillospiraceae bacterium]